MLPMGLIAACLRSRRTHAGAKDPPSCSQYTSSSLHVGASVPNDMWFASTPRASASANPGPRRGNHRNKGVQGSHEMTSSEKSSTNSLRRGKGEKKNTTRTPGTLAQSNRESVSGQGAAARSTTARGGGLLDHQHNCKHMCKAKSVQQQIAKERHPGKSVISQPTLLV